MLIVAMQISTVALFRSCDNSEKKFVAQNGEVTFKVFGVSYGNSPEKKNVIIKYQEKQAAKAKAEDAGSCVYRTMWEI